MQDSNPQPPPAQPEQLALATQSTQPTQPSAEINQAPAPPSQSAHRSVEITQAPAPAPLSTHPSVATDDVLLHPMFSTQLQTDNQTLSSGCRYVPIYFSMFSMHIL